MRRRMDASLLVVTYCNVRPHHTNSINCANIVMLYMVQSHWTVSWLQRVQNKKIEQECGWTQRQWLRCEIERFSEKTCSKQQHGAKNNKIRFETRISGSKQQHQVRNNNIRFETTTVAHNCVEWKIQTWIKIVRAHIIAIKQWHVLYERMPSGVDRMLILRHSQLCMHVQQLMFEFGVSEHMYVMWRAHSSRRSVIQWNHKPRT